MRILYCTDTYLPQINGVSIVTAISIAGLRARGWDVRVVGPEYAAVSERTGIRPDDSVASQYRAVGSVALPFYRDIRVASPLARTVEREVREFRPDIVHCATEFVIGRLGMRAASRAGIPVVTSYHTNFGQYADAYGLSPVRGVVERYLRAFHRRAARTLTPSEISRRLLLDDGIRHAQRWGCGVDIDRFAPMHRSSGLRLKLGLGSAFTLLYVGRLAAEKRVESVIRGYALARRVLPKDTLRLVVAGCGPRERALRQLAPTDTVFVGHLDRERELPELYASADAFAFASTTETLGLVVLEAMASGLPVIATPAGGVAEHLVSGVNGLAVVTQDDVSMADAMVRLVRNPRETAQLRTGARRTAIGLSWDAELDRLDATYRRVLEPATI